MAWLGLTDTQLINKIQEEVPTSRDLSDTWAFYGNQPGDAQYWLARLDAIRYEMGQVRTLMNVQTGPDRINARDQFDNLVKMEAAAIKEVSRTRGSLTVVPVTSSIPSSVDDDIAVRLNEWGG